jgi:hypothetical protein
MARKEISVEVREYFYATTDSADIYPTASECGAGSIIYLVNETTHAIDSTKIFDGTNWNTL